jgi:phenylalanine ammonia-lyase
MQLLQSGVLTDDDLNVSGLSQRQRLMPHCMPPSWTRATTAVRINQCVRGHSAICRDTISSLLKLVAAGVTPMVPLRGSISASGDLMPLSYIAGTLEGSPDIYVTRSNGTSARIMSARDALAEIGMKPLRLGPREGLGLVNGTAASAAIASLAMLDAMQLTLLSAGLTCLVSEGMAARVEWLHPFIAETRPHPGQREVAGIMRAFLKGSLLVSGMKQGDSPQHRPLNVRPDGGLAQDRYPLRTSPQWLGPQFEDLLLAYSQITVELNSTSDNPLTDPASGAIYHGGNFQAVSITSAVEKIRSGLQMVGKLLFSQCTEMLNHHMNAGLPPNLAADDPSVSFCCKGLDISIAAYQSELSYLSNSISNHVQSAEMHNQAVNSLAFLSTRYTMQAVELLGLMVAGVLYAACQAIDLRVMHATFLEAAATTLSRSYAPFLPNGFSLDSVEMSLAAASQALQNAWWDNAASDAPQRCSFGASAFVQALCEPSRNDPSTRSEGHCLDLGAKEIRQLRSDLQADMLKTYQTHRSAFMQKPTSERYVGTGSKAIYLWVRKELGIPMHCGLCDHPVPGSSNVEEEAGKQTIGSHVSKIYEAVRDGRLFEKFATASKGLGLDDEGPGTVRY